MNTSLLGTFRFQRPWQFIVSIFLLIDIFYLFADVAISAPFGNGEPGTVYIYVGANDDNNVLLQQTPIQVC